MELSDQVHGRLQERAGEDQGADPNRERGEGSRHGSKTLQGVVHSTFAATEDVRPGAIREVLRRAGEGETVTQQDRAEKRVAREGDYTKLAKDLERSEPGKRAQHYQKGRKKNLSRARRRVDRELEKVKPCNLLEQENQ